MIELRRIYQAPILWVVDRALNLVGPRYRAYQFVVTHTPPRLLERLGRWRAVRAARHARAHVPAYAQHLQRHHVSERDLWSMRFPPTDKDGDVRSYPIEERCLDGQLAFAGTTIDEYSMAPPSASERSLHRSV